MTNPNSVFYRPKPSIPAIQDYANRGFHLFAMHGIVDGKCTCGTEHTDPKKIGKHPATKNGYNDAKPALEYTHDRSHNVAVALGAISGCFVLDVDGEHGAESLKKLPPIPATFTVQTGNGLHFYFKYPAAGIKSNQGICGSGIEIKSNGSSAHLPPSKHVSGNDYKIISDAPIAEAPQWLLEMIASYHERREAERLERQAKYDQTYADSEAWSEDAVASMLDCIDPNLGYHDWIQIGMALNDGGYPFSLWDTWSAGGQSYQKHEMQHHWRSFKRGSGVTMGTLVDTASRNGWHPAPVERPAPDISKIKGFLNKPAPVAITNPMKGRVAKLESKSQGFDPLALPGLIGDTVRWITKYALFPQPELAYLNTLAFAGAVFGRRYASPINGRTNIYMVGIAGTGSGKDHSRKLINILAAQTGLSKFIGANSIRSESGLVRELEGNASQVMMIDEFGLFLQAIGDSRAAPHARQISDLLMKLYSSSSGGVYNHGTYADAKSKPITVVDPNLCLFGTTTEESYTAALSRSAIESGNLNRFIVMRPEIIHPDPNYDVPIIEKDESLIARWKAFESVSLGEQVNGNNVKPKLTIMKWGACDSIQRDILKEQANKRKTKNGALWQRLYENTIKIAMIHSIARDRLDPIFYPEDFQQALAVTRPAIEYMDALVDDHMFDSETEKHNLEVIAHIKASGGEITKSELINKMRKLKKRELDDLLVSMLDSEKLIADNLKQEKGRPKVIYRIN